MWSIERGLFYQIFNKKRLGFLKELFIIAGGKIKWYNGLSECITKKGEYAEQNYDKAIQWFRKSADQGYEKAIMEAAWSMILRFMKQRLRDVRKQ